jgi:Zn-dependent peptidase ImmA (M78 family)/DNA-binding XRE family transcriptional regulator
MAVTPLKSILADRIRTSRERLRLTQEDLAKRSGVGSHQTISQIETGERDIKAWELAKLAAALCIDFNELISSPEKSLPQLPRLLWRERPDDGAEEREACFLERCRQFRQLEVATGLADIPRLPQATDARLPDMTFSEVVRLSQETAKSLALGAKPATSLIRVLEETYKVKVWYEDLKDRGAAACVLGDFGPAMLINRTDAPWRRNFSAAHELFHLITWSALPADAEYSQVGTWDKIEKLANVFAANLLVPSEALLLEFNERVVKDRILLSDLIQLAREFDVSTEALIWRLVNLKLLAKEEVGKILKDEGFRTVDRSTMQEHWWDPPLFPERFVRLGFLAYQKAHLSRARLAQYLDTSLVNLEQRLAEYGLEEFQDHQVEVKASA